jgi:hypothetical protein
MARRDAHKKEETSAPEATVVMQLTGCVAYFRKPNVEDVRAGRIRLRRDRARGLRIGDQREFVEPPSPTDPPRL